MADAVSPSASAPPLRKTALHAAHVALGARMVPFGGWAPSRPGITADLGCERSGLRRRPAIEIAGRMFWRPSSADQDTFARRW
jgi:aminomethyltransferase